MTEHGSKVEFASFNTFNEPMDHAMAALTGSTEYMAKSYVEYQKRYRTTMRESDKVFLSILADKFPHSHGRSLLDVGCHNGNLLYHIKQNLPGFRLIGVDLFEEVLEDCRVDPELSGIEFRQIDVRKLDVTPVDVILISGVLFRFSDEDHDTIWRQLGACVKPGGYVIVFDFYNPFNQTLRIVEETPMHPEGLVLTVRPQSKVRATLGAVDFDDVEFRPFEIPIDLPLNDPVDPLMTYTRTLSDGARLQFRGSLYQPWTHLIARRTPKA